MSKKVFLCIFLLACSSLLIVSCEKDPFRPQENKHISDLIFENGMLVDGHEFDSLLIENCTFRNHSLHITNADFVTIKNCTFENIKGNGLKVGFFGEANGIMVEGCEFLDIGYNGIDSHDNAPNGSIRDCYFESVALSDIGAAMGQPHHGIYWKGKNVKILDNTFINGKQEQGNAISLRSSGIVSGNRISRSPKNGIMYFADHPGGDSLLIENNFLFNNTYSISLATPSNLDWHNKNVLIRFNTLVQVENYSVYVARDFETTTNVSIYGNLLVNSTSEFFKNFYPLDTIRNLLLAGHDEFVDLEVGDLHLSSGSPATDYCVGLVDYPATDIDGNLRNSATLDAGADAIQ